MDVKRVSDIAAVRRLENVEAAQAAQDGLIEYVACMANVDLPEDEDESAGVDEDA